MRSVSGVLEALGGGSWARARMVSIMATGAHDERDETMAAVPGSQYVVVEPELVFGCLEAILDRAAMTLDANEGLDRSPCLTPGGEVGEIAVGDITPDQLGSCQNDLAVMVELRLRDRPIRGSTSRAIDVPYFWHRPTTPPVRSSLRLCDLLGGADNPLRLAQ